MTTVIFSWFIHFWVEFKLGGLFHRAAGRFVGKQPDPLLELTMQTNTYLIPLTQQQFAIVSAEDYEWLMQWKWHAAKHGRTYYARRQTPGPHSQRKLLFMHREIAKRAGLPDSKMYDHADRNGLNNVRENIRPCTPSQSGANRAKFAARTSNSKGAFVEKHNPSRFRSRIWVHGKSISLGYWNTEAEAAQAYRLAAVKYFGEFACFG